MNKKIKIIDLLNKIANGEEPLKRIKVKDYNFIWKISENGTGYYNEKEGSGYYWLEDYLSLDNVGDLNTEVEILEDNTEEIEELEKEQEAIANPKTMMQEIRFYYDSNKMGDKINEIIRYIKRKDKSNDN